MLERRNLPESGWQGGRGLPADGRSAVAEAGYVPYGFQDFREEHEEPFNPVRLLFYVVQYRWLIAVLVTLGLVLGVVTTLMQAPRYSATARIEIMVPSARILQDLDVVAQSNDLRTFETAREKLKSRDLARRVALQLDLARNASFLFPAPDFSLGNILSRVFGPAPRASVDDFEPERLEAMAVSRILDELSIALVRGTSLLAVSYSSTDRELASAIANQVVRSYMDQQVDRTVETSELARDFLEEQVSEVKGRLEASETALVAYAQQAGISSAGDGSLVAANIQALNAALATAIQKRLSEERLVAQIDNGDGAGLEQVLESEAVQSIRGKIAELRAEYQQKLGTFKPEFPEMQRLSAQIGELERQIEQAVASITGSIKLRYQEAVQAEADLRAELVDLERQQVEFQDKNIQYTILNREVESNRTQYQGLIDKLNELGVVSEVRRANIDVVDFAVPPTSPYAPSLMRSLLLFVGVALALSAALIYVFELLNNKFSVPDQVEAELKLPVLGTIPQVDDPEQALADARSMLSESYRSLRTSLQFAGSDGAPKTLLITSSQPGEAKSTTAFKLAEEFAALGVKVLIIDCDLRRPTLHRHFKVDNGTGLTNLLTGTVEQDEVGALFRPTAHPNLTFLASGPMVPNPADLLSSARMSSILNACQRSYQAIILDGPPVVGLADALILSRLAEATMLLVSAHQVQRKEAKVALKRLRSAGGHIVGAALAKLDVERIGYGYGNMYGGYYAYGSDQKQLSGSKVKHGKIKDAASQALGGVGALVRRGLGDRLKRRGPSVQSD